MNKIPFFLFIFILIPVGLAEAQVATPADSNLDAFILPVSQSSSDDIVMLNVTAYGNIDPLTFSWSQTYNGAPIVRLQNADSSLTSFRIPYATSGQDATLSFQVRVNDGPYHITRTIDVPVTLTVKPPIVVLPREPVPGVAETILFEQQWGDTDGWTLDGQWSIASPTDTLPADTNNRAISIGECAGSCPLQATDRVELSTYHGADLVFWVWFGDQTASTDSLNIEVATAPDDIWENKHTITVGQSTHQRWFPVTVNLDEFAGDDFFLRFTPSLDGDGGTIQIDAVQLIAKTNDDVGPVLSNIPEDIVRDTLGPSVVTFVKPMAVDNVDGPVAVECDAPSGVIYPFDTVTVTCKAEDSAGNTASASFDVTLNLFIPLEIAAPDGLILEAVGELTPVNLGNATITKAATITNDAPDLFPLGNTTVTWTAQDDQDTANDTQIITIQDTTDPVITPPGDVIHEATSILSMIKLGVATATDTVDPMPTITSDAPASFPIGTTTITYTATDDSGNSATATQEITINDAEPMLILPSDVTAEATGVLTRVDIGTANVTDNIDSLTATNNATDSFPLGVTIVAWTAKDSSGNTVTAVQKITVQDTTNPYFDTPESNFISVEATGILTSVEINTVTVHDIADPDVTVTNDAPDSFPTGGTFVTWTARDSSGNTAQYNQIVIVSDRTSPTITAPDDITIEADGLLTMIQLGVATATDLVDRAPSITSDAPTSFPIGTTTITYTATDDANNRATATQKVTVRDTTEPMLILPSDVTAEATGVLTMLDIGTATVTDNVDSITATNDAPDSFPVGETMVKWIAKDNAGNVVTAIQTVIIRDTIQPTITVPDSIIAEATDELTPVDIGSATARDIADPDVTITNDSPDFFPLGSTVIEWSATDDSDNVTNDTQTVRIQDTTKPVFTSFPDDIIAATSANSTFVEFETPIATDVFAATVLCDYDSGDSFPTGSTLVTCMATDANDNSAQDSFTIRVIVPVAPDAPTDLSVSNVRVHDFVLNWSAPDLNGGTLIRYDILRDPPAPAFASTNSTTYTVTGLDSNTSSAYAIRTITDMGQSPISNIVNVTTLSVLRPDPILDLSATNITHNSLRLEWSQPELNNGTLQTYRLVMTSPHGDPTTQLALIDEPFYEVTGLTPDTDYSFRVQARTDGGYSDGDAVLDTRTSPLPPLPDPVIDLSATNITHNSLRLEWSQPDLNGGTFQNYQMLVTSPHGDARREFARTPEPFYEVTGLTPDRDYSFRVRVVTESGIGPNNPVLDTRTLPLPRSDPVLDLSATNITSGSLRLEWSQPDLNGGTFQNYQVLIISPHGNPTTQLARTIEPFYDVTGLTHNTDYSFQVQARTEGGYSGGNTILDTRTLFVPLPDPVLDLSATNITSGSLRLEWSQPELHNGTLQTYRLVMTSPHGDPQTLVGLTAEPFYEVTGLTSDTDYSFRVQARTDGGYSGGNAILDTRTLFVPLPDPILDLSATNITSGSLRLEWSQPDLYNGTFQEYRLVSTSPHGDPTTQLALTTEPFYDVTGLTHNTDYSFQVQVRTEGGYSDGNTILDTRTLFVPLPDPVLDLSATNITSGSLRLEWSQPELNNGTLQTYRLVMTSPHGDPLTQLALTTEPFYEVTGLTHNTDYSFRVQAVTEGGYSGGNTILDTRTSPLPLLPDPVNDLMVSNITSNSLRLEWTQPELNNGTLQDYRLLVTSPHGNPTTQLALTTEPFFVVTGLTPDTDYSFRVQTRTNDGFSGGDAVLDTRTSPLPPLPDPVLDLSATNITHNSLRLEWSQPDLNGGTLQNYQMLVTSPHGDARREFARTPEPFYEVTGLIPDRDYSFRVRVVTESGIGPNNPVLDTRTLPLPLPDPVLDLSATNITHNSLRLEWSQPDLNGGTFQNYQMLVTSPHGDARREFARTPEPFYEVTGLTPDRDYSFRVRVVTENGIGPNNPVLDTRTLPLPLPDPVLDLSATNITSGSLRLEWSQPDLNGGTLQNYQVLIISPHGNPTTQLARTIEPFYDVTGLTHNTDYSFQVQARTDGGYSGGNAILDTRTLFVPLPDPVLDLSAINITSGSLRLEWSQPELNNGTFQTYRLVMTSPHGNPLTQLALTTEPFYDVTGLTHNTDYSFQVQARTDGGYSDGNAILDTRTLFVPLPDPVLDLSAINITSGSLRLEWSQPELNNGTFQTYRLVMTSPHGNPLTQLALTTEPFYDVTGLTPDTDYSFRVQAVTEGGYSGGNAILDTRTSPLPPPPDPVLDLSATNITSGSLRLEWSQPDLYNGTFQEYRLVSTSPHGDPQTFVGLTAEPFFEVTGLTPDTDYSFRVQARTDGGYSDGGAILDTRTSPLPPLPDPVLDLSATNITTNSLRLEWSQPELNNGTLQTYRLVMTSPHGDPQTFVGLTAEPFFEVTGLIPDTDYSFRVQARTDGGYSGGNAIFDTTTLQDTTNPVFISFPDDIIARTSANSTFVEFESPTVRDSSPVTILCSHSSGDLFSVGSTLVTCTATDANDNSVQDSFSVTVNVVTGFESITDDFANLDSWEFVTSTLPPWKNYIYYNNFRLELSTTDGNPAPSALITGPGFGAVSEIDRDFSLENHNPDDPLHLSVDYKAQSRSSHSQVTNARLEITDTDGNSLYQKDLVAGGTKNSGWRTFGTDISQYVSGQDDITVRLYLIDFWRHFWSTQTSFDNFYLGTELLPSRNISGEADIQLTPLQELSLQISQYDQAQICGFIESLDESADTYADTLDLIRAYNMTTVC